MLAATTAGTTASAASVTPALPAWEPGDVCAVLVRGGSASATLGFPAGWAGSQGQISGQYVWGFATRTMAAGDGNPVITCSASTTWSWAAVRARGNQVSITDSAVATTPAAANAVTAPPLAAPGRVMSLILAVGRASTNTSVSSFTWSAPAGWTAGQSALADLGGGNNQRSAGTAWRDVPDAGTVAPGPAGLTVNSGAAFWLTAAHLLVAEAPDWPRTIAADNLLGTSATNQFAAVAPAPAGATVVVWLNNSSAAITAFADQRGNTWTRVVYTNSTPRISAYVTTVTTPIQAGDLLTATWGAGAGFGGSIAARAYPPGSAVTASQLQESGGVASATPSITAALPAGRQWVSGVLLNANNGGQPSNLPAGWDVITVQHPGSLQWLTLAEREATGPGSVTLSGTIVSANWNAGVVAVSVPAEEGAAWGLLRVWDGLDWRDLSAPGLAAWTGQEWGRLA
jgi:hypothetical protein